MLLKKTALALPQGGEYMGAEQTEFFRNLLLEKRTEISDRIAEHASDMQAQERVSDELDKAALEYEHSVSLRLLERLRKELDEIKRAMKRLDDGDYGYCEATGVEIGVERLILNPATLLCVDAKQALESRQKHLRQA